MDKTIEDEVTGAVIGRLRVIKVGEKYFYLYPSTLGKILFTKPLLDSINLQEANMEANAVVECLRAIQERKDDCVRFIVCHTCETKKDLYNEEEVQSRIKLFKEELSDEDLATLIITILSSDRLPILRKELGIDEEQLRLYKINKVKKRGNKNNISIGGVSIFGSLIDTACERYGWTKDYVVWGIDYTSLSLMLADKIVDIYLTDDELKSLPAGVKERQSETIKATKDNMEKIMAMDWR